MAKRRAPSHPKMKAMQHRMKACALVWRKGRARKPSYKAHMKDCLNRR